MARLLTLIVALLASALVAFPAVAQQEVEIIPLQHRFPDEVIPQLRPFVESGGVLQGANNQLILRASRRNRDEIKRLLASLDRPLRRLVIQVSRERQESSVRQDAGASGTVVLGDGTVKLTEPRRLPGGASVSLGSAGSASRLSGSAADVRASRSERSVQTVQVVEGGQAFIQVGQSIPIPLTQVVVGPAGTVVSQSMVWQDLGQGFYAEPRVAGDRVTLEISPQTSRPGAYGPGSAQVERLSTTVSGRLGEWIQVGGSGQESNGRERVNASVSARDSRDGGAIWLKVDELP